MALPPVFAASALYDNLLQSALRQFFGRATFETEPIPSLSSDGRLAIEPTNDPSVLSIRWFGSRHVLHVPARRPFTPHEVRLAKAIGSVLALRYRAIFDPKQMLERGDLFRGAIEDRYVSAFLNAQEQNDAAHARADLVATALEILRVAALSSYENKAISSGVLLVDTTMAVMPIGGDGSRRAVLQVFAGADRHQELLPPQRRARDAVPRQPRRHGARHRRDRALRDIGEPHRSGDSRRAVPDGLPRRTRRATGNNRNICRRPQPVARDQGVRAGRRDLQLPERALAPARRPGEVRDVGARRRERRARQPLVSDGARSGRRAAGRAVRRPARCGGVAAAARGARRSARRAARQARRRARPRPAAAHAARPQRRESRPGRARRPGEDRRRDGHGRHRAACWPSAPS